MRIPATRLAARQEHTAPIVAELEAWLTHHRARVAAKSPLGEALKYISKYWNGLCLFLTDGRVEIDNNTYRPYATSGHRAHNFLDSPLPDRAELFQEGSHLVQPFRLISTFRMDFDVCKVCLHPLDDLVFAGTSSIPIRRRSRASSSIFGSVPLSHRSNRVKPFQRRLIQPEISSSHVRSQMRAAGGAGDQQDVRAALQQPRKGDALR